MKKKIIIGIGLLVCILAILYLVVELFNQWEDSSLSHKLVTIATLIGWTFITYDVATFKRKWMQKLVK